MSRCKDAVAGLPSALAVRYGAVRYSSHPVDRERTIVVIEDSQEVVEVPLADAQILSLCQGCRSIEEHVDAITEMRRVRDPTMIRPTLHALVSARLLRSQADLLSGTRSTTPVAPPNITTIGIATADRSETLRRCIDLITKHCDRFGRRPRILVVDGSGARSHAATNRAVVARTREEGFDALYVGAAEAASLRRAYEVRGFDRDTLQFALTPGHVGSNRNLLLLLTAGEHILMIDDDVRLEPWATKERELTVAFRGHGDARRVCFFRSRMEAFRAAEPVDVDLLGAHGTLLGRSLTSLLNEAAAGPDLRDACGHMLSSLSDVAVSLVVRVTMTGLAGDSGSHCAHRLLFSKGALHTQLASSRDAFETALSSREVHCIARQPIVTHDHGCMAYCMGLANYPGVPAFLPVGRNEDGVFGAMLAFCQPSTLFGHLPFGILHDSDRPSDCEFDVIPSVSHTRISDVVLLLLGRAAAAEVSGSTDSRIARLAMTLIEAGALAPKDLSVWVARSVLEAKSHELVTLNAAMSGDGSTYASHWRAARDRYRDCLLKQVVKPNFFLPIEFHGDDTFERVATFLRNCGSLVRAWPDLITAQRAQPWSFTQ